MSFLDVGAGGLKALNPYYSLFSKAMLRPGWFGGDGVTGCWPFATARASPMELVKRPAIRP